MAGGSKSRLWPQSYSRQTLRAPFFEGDDPLPTTLGQR